MKDNRLFAAHATPLQDLFLDAPTSHAAWQCVLSFAVNDLIFWATLTKSKMLLPLGLDACPLLALSRDAPVQCKCAL